MLRRRALPLLLSLLVAAASPPSAQWLRFHVQAETANSVLLVNAATASGGALFGAASIAFEANNAITSDLDFDFELDLDDDGDADDADDSDMSITHHGLLGEDSSRQQFTQVELSALDDGDLEAPKAPSLRKIAPNTFNFGRGIEYVATTTTTSQEPLFSLPFNQIMSLESAKRNRVGLLLNANPDLPPAIALAVHLLEERFLGDKSNFSQFIDSLPPAADGLDSALFYKREELELLQGSQLLRVIAARASALEQFFQALLEPLTSAVAVSPPLFAPDEFTLANFRWAMGVVWSHAFPVGDTEADVVLAPVLSTISICVDSNSSSCSPNRIEMDYDKQELVVHASRDYAPGEEAVLFFGDKSSTMLMVNHGFTRPTPSSTLDKMDLSIVLEVNDPLADVKAFLITTQNMSMNDTYVLRYNSKKLDESMLTSLRIKVLSGAEMGRYKDLLGPVQQQQEEDTDTVRKQPSYSEPRHIVSLRNEFAATRALLLTCSNLLKQYPTSLEQDQERLRVLDESEHTNSREKQIRKMLVLEKQILHNAMQIAKQQWADLVFSDHPNLLRVGN